MPGEACPTGRELVASVLAPLAALPEIAPNLRLGTRGWSKSSREGLLKHEEIAPAERGEHRPFRLLLSRSNCGGERIENAAVVLDCHRHLGQPNRLGDGGIPAPGERALDGEIRRAVPGSLRGSGRLGRQDHPPRRRRPLGADRRARPRRAGDARRRGRG